MPDVKINSIKFTEDAYFFVLEDGEKLSKKEYYFDEEAGYLLLKGLKIMAFNNRF